MLSHFIDDATHVYLACGATDFRKQSDSLSILVTAKFKLDPYEGAMLLSSATNVEMPLKS